MSVTAFSLYSSTECKTISSLPLNSMFDLESFKSKRYIYNTKNEIDALAESLRKANKIFS